MVNEKKVKKPIKRRIIWSVTAFIVVWMGMDFYFSNFVLSFETEHIVLAGLPAAFDDFKIIHLSDLHETSFGENNHDLLFMIEKSHPDIIAITGDLIDSVEDLPYAESLCAELLRLAPVYYVTGNHEWGGKAARPLKASLARMGVHVLANTWLIYSRDGENICIAGLEDLNGPKDMKNLPEVMDGIRKDMGGSFVLMLSHRYDRIDEYARENIDLVLSGHAHGGMVRLPFTDGVLGPGRVFFPKYTDGVYTVDSTVMHTSRGIGSEGFPTRLFNRPHVAEIVLYSK